MNRWIFIGLATLATVSFVLWQRSGTKTEYINGLPLYRDLPGQEYILQQDCYLFKLDAHDTAYPLIGANAAGIPMRVAELPELVSAAQVGTTARGVRILDTCKAGSRFRIVSVRRERSPDSTRITFEVLLENEAERKYPRLDAYYIMDHSPESQGRAPSILPEFAARRVKG